MSDKVVCAAEAGVGPPLARLEHHIDHFGVGRERRRPIEPAVQFDALIALHRVLFGGRGKVVVAGVALLDVEKIVLRASTAATDRDRKRGAKN